MRPLMICRQFLPVAHGAETQAAQLARRITELGHPVRVVAGRLKEDWPERETINGVEVVRLPSPRKRLLGTWKYLAALRRHLIQERDSYDVIHVIFAKHSAALAGRMKSRLGVPVVCKPACTGEYGDLEAIWKTLAPRTLMKGIMKIDRLIAISDEIATEWVGAGFPFEKIVRIPNGVDTERFRPATAQEKVEARRRLNLPQDALVVIGVGRLERQKGFGLLLEAVGRIEQPHNIHIALAGEGSRRAELNRLAKSIGLADRTHFLGRVKTVEDVYRAADLFCLPSRGEGMSNSLLEAMACGLDVVATRVSGVAELIREGINGLLVAPESSLAFADAIQRWLGGMHGELGRAARQTIESGYSLQAVAEQTIELYRQVIEEVRESRR